jgi:hypothetical protein
MSPIGPASTAYQFLNSYDLAGDVTCTNNGVGAFTGTINCGNYGAATNSITAAYGYDSAARLTTLTAGTPCASGTCAPFAQTQIYSATSYGPVGILAASYGNGLNLTHYYDNRMVVMDHEIFNASDTFGWATVSITGTEQTGDSGWVSVTAGGVSMKTSYGTGSTPVTLAQALMGIINQTQASLVQAAICTSTSCPAVSPSLLAQTIRVQAFQPGTTGDMTVSAISTDAGSTSPSFTATASGTVLQNGAGSTAYYYKLQYAPNGNIASSADLYNGTANYGYDTLNRLISSHRTGEGPINGVAYQYQCWSYDGFGNRLSEVDQNVACPGQAPGASNNSGLTTYTVGNHVISTTTNSADPIRTTLPVTS